MCGIAGFVGLEDDNLIKKMTHTLAHRGPDDYGFYIDDDICLGHRRLSIIDLSEKGRQPLQNEDGSVWVVVNGEIYNFMNLRKKLEENGHVFSSNTDSEVIVHLYEEFGTNFVKYLHGMFAFALWDQDSKVLILARDRIGKRPIYFSFHGGNLFFASEIKALLKAGIPAKVNLKALHYFLHLGFTPGDITMFEGIKKLEPGTILMYKSKKINIKNYWDVYNFSDILKDERYFVNTIKNILRKSVRDRLVSDRPLGLFLSGGVDSTTVLYFLSKIVDTSELKTFSVGFDIEFEEEKFNQDLYIAKKTSEFFGTDHQELLISEKDLINNFNNVIYHMDEPIENETQIAVYMLSKYAKREVAVVLSGNGGDELFGGYSRYYRYIYQPKKVFLEYLSILPEKFKVYTVSKLINMIFPEYAKVSKVAPSINNNLISRYVVKWYLNNKIPLDKRIMYIDLKNKLAENFLMTTDKMTMAHGLEQREPILDYRLVKFAFRIPTKYKIRENTTKYIIKQIIKDAVPRDVLQGKRYWFTPVAKWMRMEFKDVAEQYLSEKALKKTGYFDPKYVQNMFRRHLKQIEYNRSMIWKILTFQAWYNIYIDDVL